MNRIDRSYPVAPLHNPANVTGIEAVTELMPNTPQVGVFDTAFHQTMPAKAYMYALVYALPVSYSCYARSIADMACDDSLFLVRKTEKFAGAA